MELANDVDPEVGGQGPTGDPIADKSLSGPLLIFTALLFFALLWALYDELSATRPWKSYQRRFVSLYTSYLKKLGPKQATVEKAVRGSADFRKIEQQVKEAEAKAGPRMTEIDREMGQIRQALANIKEPFQDARARVAALTYELDHATSTGSKESIRRDIQNLKKGPFRVAKESLGFGQLEQRFADNLR